MSCFSFLFVIVAVQAIARCCSKTGLQCTYMKAGPSGHSKEDQIEVLCPANNLALGAYFTSTQLICKIALRRNIIYCSLYIMHLGC
jgi:hypothetical protein